MQAMLNAARFILNALNIISFIQAGLPSRYSQFTRENPTVENSSIHFH
jgi:hypothetical protein